MPKELPRGASLPFVESLALATPLFAFWVVLSGKLDPFHLGAGAAAALAIAYASCRLYAPAPAIGPPGKHPFVVVPWRHMPSYLPWLAAQIFVSSFQVARVVLSPRMDVRPKLFWFSYPLPHGMARTTLAHSITLTPGTVTIDLRGDDYLVHALVEESAEDLEGDAPGNMKERVAAYFGERRR